MLHHTHCIAVKQEQAVSLTVLLQTQIKRMNPVEIGVNLQRKSYTKKITYHEGQTAAAKKMQKFDTVKRRSSKDQTFSCSLNTSLFESHRKCHNFTPICYCCSFRKNGFCYSHIPSIQRIIAKFVQNFFTYHADRQTVKSKKT